ncbi:hypothetical protein B484DRAFT_99362 [Ochromonadaceae sp. CCMP2298]|nr:hypothetical protein B484DRAFT_99362 [Ochromonadaceae sp. CCMP2298]
MQRLQRGSDASVRQLRVDLATAHRELAAAQAKDSVRTEGEDGKTKSFLGKIKNLDEELTSARGTNAFLKRQLDTCSLSLKVAQDEHAKQLQQLQTRLTTRTGVGARAGGGYRSPDRGFTSPGAGGAGAGVMGGGMGGGSPDLYDEMAQALHLEQEHTALLRRQLHGLENSPPKKP